MCSENRWKGNVDLKIEMALKLKVLLDTLSITCDLTRNEGDGDEHAKYGQNTKKSS